jgi:hypothetical protein
MNRGAACSSDELRSASLKAALTGHPQTAKLTMCVTNQLICIID